MTPSVMFGYDQTLQFVNQTYALSDPRAEQAKCLIDFAYEKLTPLYDVIWPLIAQFERWLERASHRGHVPAEALIEDLGEASPVYHAPLYWKQGMGKQGMGVLMMNLLDDVIELVEGGKGPTDFAEVLERRVAVFLHQAYPGGLASAVAVARRFFAPGVSYKEPVSWSRSINLRTCGFKRPSRSSSS